MHGCSGSLLRGNACGGYEPQTSQFMRKWSIKEDKGSNVIPGRQQSISKASACYLFSFPSRGIPGGFLSLTSVLQNVIIIVTVWVAVSKRGFEILGPRFQETA